MKTTKKQKLEKLLGYLKNNQSLQLEDDTFLCTGGLDGSDKIYGFFKEGGHIYVISRQCNEGYPIGDMDKDDLIYIFDSSSIAKKIEEKKYKIEKR